MALAGRPWIKQRTGPCVNWLIELIKKRLTTARPGRLVRETILGGWTVAQNATQTRLLWTYTSLIETILGPLTLQLLLSR